MLSCIYIMLFVVFTWACHIDKIGSKDSFVQRVILSKVVVFVSNFLILILGF